VLNVGSIYGSRRIDRYTPSRGAADGAAADGRLPRDKVTLSPEARQQLRVGQPGDGRGQASQGEAGTGQGTRGQAQAGSGRQLTEEQQRQVQELERRDAHVRQHEAAHQAAGGDLTGPASYTYETGPNGRSYAVGGEVQVVARSGRTPDETIAIARRVRAAALAPADPSPADLAAASQAAQLEVTAEAQKRQQVSAPALSGAQVGLAARGTGRSAPQLGRAELPPVSLERLIVRSPEPEPFM